MGPWLSRKRAQGKGKAIKMPHTLLPQRKQIKMNAAGLPPEEAKVPKARGAGGLGAGGSAQSPRQPARWLKGKQGCVPFTWWPRWGSGGCWHENELHHLKLFSQHQLVQLSPFSNFLRLP